VAASERDHAVASEILIEAASGLIARREPLWQPAELAPALLRGQVEDGSLHLGLLHGEPVATVVLRWEDELFWPDARAGESAFIHRLAVRRNVAGTGVAHALIAWAEVQAFASARTFLRLDCSARHPGLARYYEAAGFERHSEGGTGHFAFVRYQKRLR
jgi:GNAT superfamily N-acetyltransferase